MARFDVDCLVHSLRNRRRSVPAFVCEFFRETAPLLKSPLLGELADRYERLGVAGRGSPKRQCRRASSCSSFSELVAERAELVLSGGAEALSRLREIAGELTELETSAANDFPLAAVGCDRLLADLQSRVLELHRDEVAAHEIPASLVRENS